MKLQTLISDSPRKKMKLMITETQLRNLAAAIILAEEEGSIKKTYLVKQINNGKKK